MNAQVIQLAKGWIAPSDFSGRSPSRPAIIMIDGTRWTSPRPINHGEAASMNDDARRITEALSYESR
jgi:hypothetical protein